MIPRIIFLALVVGLSAFAQAPTNSEFRCIETGRSLACSWVSSNGSANTKSQLAFDYEGDDIDFATAEGTTHAARRAHDLASLPLDSDVYLIPRSRDTSTNWSVDVTCTEACNPCNSANLSLFADDSPADLICDGAGAYPKIHTSAADPACGSPPCEPVAPTHSGLTACPAITGATRTVNGTGSDFLTHWDAAKTAAAAGTVEEIIVPAGVAIRPEDQTGAPARFTLDNIANGGWVVIRPDSDPKLLPPPGTMVDPSYWPHMGHFQFNTDPTDNDRGIAAIWSGSAADRGYCLENIHHTSPPVDELVSLSVSVTAIDTTTDVLTASSLAGFQNEMIVMVDLANIDDISGSYVDWIGPRRICSISGNTFQITGLSTGQNFCAAGKVDFTGADCAANCGTLNHWIAKEVGSISNTTPVELTVTDHKLVNFPALTIDGSTAATNVTVTDPDIFGANTAVYVSGTSVGTCDGLWISGTVSGSAIPLSPPVGSVTAADCTGVTSGSIRRVTAISLVNTSDADLGQYKPVNFPFLATDANTIQLLGTTAQGTVTGGVIYHESESSATWISVGTSAGQTPASDFVCDRCSFQTPPWFRGAGISHLTRSNKTAFVSSWLEGAWWRRVNPVNGVVEAVMDNLTDNAYTSIYAPMAQDVQVDNSMFYPNPFFFTDTPSTPATQHYSLTRNVFLMPDWAIPSHSAFGGFDHNLTFMIEFKDCDVCALVGNYGKGFFSVRNFSQAFMEFSGFGRTDTTFGRTGDIRIAHNTMESGGGCIHITVDGTERNRIHEASERWLIENNLCVEIDGNEYDGLGGFTGGRFVLNSGVVDMIVRNNTYVPWRAWRPVFWEQGGNWSQGASWADNILVATEGGFTEEIGVRFSLTCSGRVPCPIEDDGQAAMTERLRHGLDADTLSSFTSNIIVPGVESSLTNLASKWTSTADADTISVNEATAKAQLDMAGNTFVGSATACGGGTCPDSLADRMALTFESGTYEPTATYSGEGADVDALEDAQGWVTTPSVTGDASSLTISYHAPTTTGCNVDLAPWNTDWATTWATAGNITRTQDVSASQSQSVQFTGLSALTQYAYRIQCAKTAIGVATTGQ